MTPTDSTAPAPGSGYTVEVTDINSAQVAGVSGSFTIEPARSLTVTSVVASSGGSIMEGQSVDVVWTTTNNIPNVHISLKNDVNSFTKILVASIKVRVIQG